jgi:hypothetical protein
LVVVLAGGLAGCGGLERVPESEVDLPGTWVADDCGATLTFNADGSLSAQDYWTDLTDRFTGAGRWILTNDVPHPGSSDSVEISLDHGIEPLDFYRLDGRVVLLQTMGDPDNSDNCTFVKQ